MIDEEFKPLVPELGNGIGEEVLIDGDPPEPVDLGAVQAFLDGKLDDARRKHVIYLIARYRAWHEAFGEALVGREAPSKTVVANIPRNWRRWSAIAFAVAACLMIMAFWATSSKNRLTDGALQIARRADGRVTGLEPFDDHWRQEAEESFTSGVAPSEQIAGLLTALPDRRKGPAAFANGIVAPYLTVVRSQRPVLKWREAREAERYRVQVFQLGVAEPVAAEVVTTTEWKVPERLERGVTYRWQVVYLTGDSEFIAPGPEQTPALFTVADAASVKRLENAESTLQDSQLLLGLLYAREGLLDEAEAAWRRLQTANPRSELVEQLLNDLQRMRGRQIRGN